jgi:RNA exonuclease 4
VKRIELNASKVQMTDGDKAHYVALDCEMVGVGYKGQESVVARVTIINWDVEIILDCFVRCDQFVVDYRTHVSGITKDDLESEYAISFCECQWLVAELIHDKVLVGHALKNDLRVLGIQHPWYDTRDTAKYEPFMKQRFEDGILWPRKLKDLAKEILGREIQMPGHPHSAFEDALAALDLYKKKRSGWEKVMEYKVNKMVQMCMPRTQHDEER